MSWPTRGARSRRAHAHYDDDLAFWLRHGRRLGGPVLDLGAAAGRVSLPLARLGLEVICTDSDPEMLAEIDRVAVELGDDVRRRIRTVQGELQRINVDQPISLALVAMNTLQVLTDPGDRLACLAGVAGVLAPEGELIFDLIVPDFEEIASTLGVVRHVVAFCDDAGSVLQQVSFEDVDEASGNVLMRTILDLGDPSGRMWRSVEATELHLYTPAELANILPSAGLEVITVEGGFAGEPFDEASERQVYRCRRAR